MIDAHCHLYDLEESKWANHELEVMICAGGDLESSRKSVELAEKYSNVFATVGQHPESPERFDKAKLLELIKNRKVVAVGECGLDSDNEREVELFKQNIDLAIETELPLVVHCRGMFEQVFETLRYQKVQMHCFTGNMAEMEECARRRWYMSFGGILTFKKSVELRAVAKAVPAELLLVETDSPYLSPEPVRGEVNKPSNVRIVLEKLAEIRGVTFEQVEKLTTMNAKKLFNI